MDREQATKLFAWLAANPDQIDPLLTELHEKARNRCIEYGLPVYCEVEMAWLRSLVLHWFANICLQIPAAPPCPPQDGA